MPVAVNRVGFGGVPRVQFACDGRTSGNLIFTIPQHSFVSHSAMWRPSL